MPLESPSRSLLLDTDTGAGHDAVVIVVLISTPGGISLAPGDEINDVRLDFWVDLAEMYISGTGQEFHLGYPSRLSRAA